MLLKRIRFYLKSFELFCSNHLVFEINYRKTVAEKFIYKTTIVRLSVSHRVHSSNCLAKKNKVKTPIVVLARGEIKKSKLSKINEKKIFCAIAKAARLFSDT